MKVKAQRVAFMRDNKTICRPSEGYGDDLLEIDDADYTFVMSMDHELPSNDQPFPKGAPRPGFFKVGNKILRKK